MKQLNDFNLEEMVQHYVFDLIKEDNVRKNMYIFFSQLYNNYADIVIKDPSFLYIPGENILNIMLVDNNKSLEIKEVKTSFVWMEPSSKSTRESIIFKSSDMCKKIFH